MIRCRKSSARGNKYLRQIMPKDIREYLKRRGTPPYIVTQEQSAKKDPSLKILIGLILERMELRTSIDRNDRVVAVCFDDPFRQEFMNRITTSDEIPEIDKLRLCNALPFNVIERAGVKLLLRKENGRTIRTSSASNLFDLIKSLKIEIPDGPFKEWTETQPVTGRVR